MLWYERYGWESNPFELKPTPDTVSGFEDIRSALLEYIKSGDCCLLFGEEGLGKTSLLKWLEKYALQEYVPVYINTSGMRDEEIEKLNIDRIIRDKLNFFDKIVKKEREIVILIDDMHNLPLVLSEAVKRNFDDRIVKAVIMASSVQSVGGGIAEKVGRRIVVMRPMEADEAMNMIVKRVGYRNPFDHEGLELIFRKSKYVPKTILENCEMIAKACIEKSISAEFVKSFFAEEGVKTRRSNFIKKLSPLQKSIVELLKEGEYRPKELAQKLRKPTKTITSQLAYLSLKSGFDTMRRKGVDEPVVERKPGKDAIYRLTDGMKELLTKE